MEQKIPFNKPYFTGNELTYIKDAVESGKISGDGKFSRLCQSFFEDRFGFGKCLLTTSATDALEMCALLLDIQAGDEIIMPSFTFVSTANAFMLRNAKIVFADSRDDHPNLEVDKIESLITPRTKAIVVVHYAGIACEMKKLMALATRYNIQIVEDAAQAINSFYESRALGGLGILSCFSFHETKNVNCGEGGLLVVNDKNLTERAEIIREKGTNRSAFFRGEINKYNWVALGSSFLPSDLNAAYLYAQISQLEKIQARRVHIWNSYFERLRSLAARGLVELPLVPEYATNTGHIFYLVCADKQQRIDLLDHLKQLGIMATFHYQSLHKSPFFAKYHDGRVLRNSDRYTDCLLRLPLYFELTDSQIIQITDSIVNFFNR
jgi:dTDP-4-amino-4,6-dideoxygalactose transaminase